MCRALADRVCLLVLWVGFIAAPLAAQDNRVNRPDYQQAAQYSTPYLRQFLYDTQVTPRWIGQSDQFWYSFRTSQGTSYSRVDARSGTKTPLFDRVKLAAQLMEFLQKPLDPAALALARLGVNNEGTKLKFVADDFEYEYDLASEKLTKLGKAQALPTLTPPPGGFRSREEVEQFMEQQRQRLEELRNNQNQNQQRNQQENQQQEQQQDQNQQQNQQQQNQQQTVQRTGAPGAATPLDHRVYSPDRKAYVFAKGHNLYYVELKEEPKKEADKQAAAKDETKQSAQQNEAKKDDTKQDDAKKEDTKKDDAKKEDAKDDSKKDEAKKDEAKSNTEKSEDAKSAAKKDGEQKEEVKQEDRKATEPDDGAPQEKANEVTKEEAQKANEKKDAVQADAVKADSTKTDAAKADESQKGDAKQDEAKKSAATQSGSQQQAARPAQKSTPARPTPPVDHDGEAIQLTTDGVEDYSFAGRVITTGGTTGSRGAQTIAPDRKTRPVVTWSRDSQAFYVYRRDSRGVADLWVVNSLANPRPALEKYKYAMPGEEKVSKGELHVFHRAAKKILRIPSKWKDESIDNPLWGKSGDELFIMRRDRLLRHVEFCTVNTKTAAAQCLISEGFENAYLVPPSVRFVEESDEFVWWSERSGWGHFYLYDRSGKLKNAITSGPYRASRISSIDPKNRLLYFVGNGREPNENIYFNHLYCVHLDGSGLTLLDPGDADHSSSLSPSKRFLVDNSSRVDQQPSSVLREASGKKILDLEQADLSRLAEIGWRLPETFIVKAADGVTDLYGNMWKPFNFDPKKKYPIIAHVYPGPQQEGTNHTFSATVGDQQLAQLGFIVIQVGHRGGAPTRSKAYANYGYFNMRDYGLADKKAAIEQLAARHSFIDIARVGIYGHSGGGFMTAAALLQKPYNEFFKVGVSTSGNHDNNVYNNSWAERYHGLKEVAVTQQSGSQTGARVGMRGTTGTTGTTGSQTVGQRRDGGGGPESGFAVEAGDYFFETEELFDGDLALHDAWLELAAQLDGPQEGKQTDGQQTETKQTETKAGTQQSQAAKTQSGTAQTSQTGSGQAAQQTPQTKFEIKVPTNAELAANLKGHLLLVHGELDNNVHPANTLRLVDALVKANKRFDMLYLPGQRHGYAGEYQPYVTQRMFEYFAEHLLGDYQAGADLNDKSAPRDDKR